MRRLMNEKYELFAEKPIDADMNSDTNYKDFHHE